MSLLFFSNFIIIALLITSLGIRETFPMSRIMVSKATKLESMLVILQRQMRILRAGGMRDPTIVQ